MDRVHGNCSLWGVAHFPYANVVLVLHKSHITAVIWGRVRQRAKHTPLMFNQVPKQRAKHTHCCVVCVLHQSHMIVL